MSASTGDDDLDALIKRAHGAWHELVGPEHLRPQVPVAPPPAPKPAVKKPPRKPLDVATALDWYDEVLRYRAENPRPAQAAEIAYAFELHRGRYGPTQFPLPVGKMVALKLSVGQWRDVFARADAYLTKKGAPQNTPPPYQLFLKIAAHHAEYRKKICQKDEHLTHLRRANRPAPTEPNE